MRLTTLLEDIDGQTFEQVVRSLIDRVLISFKINTTSINPEEHSQIVSIAAFVVDPIKGEELASFDETVHLTRKVEYQIRQEDKTSDDMIGSISIRDMLNAADYDIEDSYDNPNNEMDMLMRFKALVDDFRSRAILITHNADFAMRHLDVAYGTDGIGGIPVIDTLQFTRTYMMPILHILADQNHNQAIEMLEKLKSLTSPTLHDLGRALHVKMVRMGRASTSAIEVRRLIKIFMSMIGFLYKNRKLYDSDEYTGTNSADKYESLPTEPLSTEPPSAEPPSAELSDDL